MATLVFTALGTAIGGPLGGALGALVGNQLDYAIVGSSKREGPRLKELLVTTSSYGTPIAKHFGRIRAPGAIIWATDLQETREKSGGSKGKPSLTSYTYSASFAVALASRPIRSIGRIWADGNLLRGAGGDLKVGGELRIYNGYGDQMRDPLIASDRGSACPAFRNIAYCVFESLQLSDFGNRIPGLTFEIIADEDEIGLSDITEDLSRLATTPRALPELVGFSNEGGPLTASLATIDQVYPLICDGSRKELHLTTSEEHDLSFVPQLPEPAADIEGDSFGTLSGKLSRRQSDERAIPDGLRYYDIDRDYQAGLQRADGRANPGRTRTLEFPGALPATKARQLCDSAVQRARWSGEHLMWRIAEIDSALAPGQVVSVPNRNGLWRVESWEWRNSGIELELRRLPPGPARRSQTEAGAILSAPDKTVTPTVLYAFELPWNGKGSGADRQVYAAASSTTDGWTGAALYAENSGTLTYLQPSGKRRSVLGALTSPVESSSACLFDRNACLHVQLISDQFGLSGTSMRGLAEGRNRILVGGEVMQFVGTNFLGAGLWKLSGLLRGRGGTEVAALEGHEAGTAVVLLDDMPIVLDTGNGELAANARVAAIGLADPEPVISEVANSGLSRAPLVPVHPNIETLENGGLRLSWTRRARGAWEWPETMEIPVNETTESYLVGVGDVDTPEILWEVTEPRLELQPEVFATLQRNHSGKSVWVRQIGSHGLSYPLLIRVFD